MSHIMIMQNGYNITNGFTISYFIDICNSTSAPLLGCQDVVCSHYFNVSSSPCSSYINDISISVFATNVFGSSPRSSKIVKG